MPPAKDEQAIEQSFEWQPSREHALSRLQAFLPNAGETYTTERNFDLGAMHRGNVSLLSPWIRHRLILESEILRTTLKTWSQAPSEKFVQEVFWRTYFKGWLQHYPQVWDRYQADLQKIMKSLGSEPVLSANFDRASEARTGIECFDTWVRELVDTGYLHNHARMWFASIWIFTLKLPWQLGADFFYRHLLDGDPASNTLSWRWVAGLHTKGKTYLARADNIAHYTQGRFAHVEGLAERAPALIEENLGPAKDLSRNDFPAFDRDYAFLVTSDDCLPETLPIPRPPVAAFGISRVGHPIDSGERVLAFCDNALADALGRVEARFAVPTVRGGEKHIIEQVVDWVHGLGVKNVVCARVPVGPGRALIDKIGETLSTHGITFLEIQRDYDSTVWPYTKRGFFALKKKIPAIIETLNFGDS